LKKIFGFEQISFKESVRKIIEKNQLTTKINKNH